MKKLLMAVPIPAPVAMPPKNFIVLCACLFTKFHTLSRFSRLAFSSGVFAFANFSVSEAIFFGAYFSAIFAPRVSTVAPIVMGSPTEAPPAIAAVKPRTPPINPHLLVFLGVGSGSFCSGFLKTSSSP